MPMLPSRPCRHPGCPALVETPARYCQAHVGEEDAQDRDRRGGSAERGYTYQWRKIRLIKLRQNPICETTNCGHAANEVHHQDGNPRNNTPENLKALCKPCHSAIKDRGEIGYKP